MFNTILVIINDFIALHADVPVEYAGSVVTELRTHYRGLYSWETVWIGEAANAPYTHYPTRTGSKTATPSQYIERCNPTKQVIKRYIHPRLQYHSLVDSRTPYCPN